MQALHHQHRVKENAIGTHDVMIHAFGSWTMSQEGWGEERSISCEASEGRTRRIPPDSGVSPKGRFLSSTLLQCGARRASCSQVYSLAFWFPDSGLDSVIEP